MIFLNILSKEFLKGSRSLFEPDISEAFPSTSSGWKLKH